MRIRTYLALIVAIVSIPIFLAATLALVKIRQDERDSAIRALSETTRSVSLKVDREAQGSLSAMQVLGNSENLETRNFKEFYKHAVALNRPGVWTVLLDSTGSQIVDSIAPFAPSLPAQTATRSTVAFVLENQRPLVGNLSRGPVTLKLVTAIYSPAKAAGGKAFVIAQAFDVEHWKSVALQENLPADWIGAIIDRDGKFIARTHRTSEFLGKAARPELVAAAAAANSGVIRHLTLEGIDSYDAFTHSELTGWTIALAAPVVSIEAAANRAVRLAGAGMLLAVMITLGVAFLFGRRLVSAVGIASHAALLLGQGRKPPVARSTITELQQLNQALSNASDLLEEERSSRQVVERERQHLLQKEIEVRKSAQAQNLAKDRFLAMLGHELRNPLAAIAGATTMLNMGTDDKLRVTRCVEIIDRQNRHLNYIVDDLLDVSRLLAGKIVLHPQPLDLADSIKRCIDGIRGMARAQGYTLASETEPVWAMADTVRIEQILNNLINNGMKFSPVGSTIRVGLRAEAGHAVITVSDDGAGMPADVIPHLFEPFFQGPPAANRIHAGLGIGLALVRQLVELHGGDVQATSEGVDRGSQFIIRLPCLPEPPESLPAAHEAPIVVKRKVVFVEDNADARLAMTEVLRTLGYDVAEVALGAEARAAVLSVRPDAVLVDIGLPDIDGYEVARRLRADPETRDVVIVALTGYGKLSGNPDPAHVGLFDAYFVKPVDVFKLTDMVESLLAARMAASEPA